MTVKRKITFRHGVDSRPLSGLLKDVCSAFWRCHDRDFEISDFHDLPPGIDATHTDEPLCALFETIASMVSSVLPRLCDGAFDGGGECPRRRRVARGHGFPCHHASSQRSLTRPPTGIVDTFDICAFGGMRSLRVTSDEHSRRDA